MFFARDPISFPAELSAILENSLQPEARHLGEALRSLWPKLAKRRGQTSAGEQHYSFQRAEAEAYAAYYLPVNCLKAALVLEESYLLGVDPVPSGEAKWLDFGTGPGTAFWGLAWWCAKRGKKLRFTGWDQSAAFTKIAASLTEGNPLGASAEFLATKDDPVTLLRKLKPTHVSFLNSLAEIFPDPKARFEQVSQILRTLHDLKKADGKARYLLLLEPGSRESSRELAFLKDQLQSHQTGAVLLPCLDERPCGALANPQDWCHEEVGCEFPEWVNALGAKAGMRKESLLFSYAWMQPGSMEALPWNGSMRIVSQRMERKGQVECRLCTVAGKRMVRVQRSKASAETEGLFQAARGDLWQSAELGEKGDLIGSRSLPTPSRSTIFSPA